MSNRQTSPPDEALTTWRKSVDAAIGDLQQRPQGSPNGLMAPGGAAGSWVPLTTFSGTWLATNIAGQQTPQYTMDADGFVHLRGFVRNTVSFPAGIIATLPLGYRSAALELFATPNGGGSGPGISQISVDTDGTIRFANLVGNGWNATNWISLSPIMFYVGGQ